MKYKEVMGGTMLFSHWLLGTMVIGDWSLALHMDGESSKAALLTRITCSSDVKLENCIECWRIANICSKKLPVLSLGSVSETVSTPHGKVLLLFLVP